MDKSDETPQVVNTVGDVEGDGTVVQMGDINTIGSVSGGGLTIQIGSTSGTKDNR